MTRTDFTTAFKRTSGKTFARARGIKSFPPITRELDKRSGGRLRQLAAMRGETATAEWAKLLMSLGILHSELAEYKDSADAFLESLAISRRLGDRSAEVVTLNNLGVSQRLHGSYDSAVRYLEEALAILREDSDAAAVARTLTNLAATCVERGDVDRSRSLYAEAFPIFERLGDTSGMAVTLHGAGDTYRAAGSFEDAESAYQPALDAYGLWKCLSAWAHPASDTFSKWRKKVRRQLSLLMKLMLLADIAVRALAEDMTKESKP